jgi:hypothetical protein
MGTVSGPFLIIRNLSAVFDDDTREEFPPDLRNEEEDATMVFFLNRADSLDSVAVFEDIEAAEDDAVLNMTNDVLFSSLYLFFPTKFLFFFFSLSIYIV